MAGARTVLAADIGATWMRAALVDEAGTVLARRSCATEPARGFEDATTRLAEMLRDVRAESTPLAVGIATAGPVDPRDGTYGHPPNLPGWHGRSMVGPLEEALGLPVAVGHDATLSAMAEARFGAARGLANVVYLTVSSGIGAGIVVDGRPVTGAHGGAGEVGHMIVAPGGPSCGAGCPGCLEAMASGTGIAAEARRRIEAGAGGALAGSPTAAEVVRAAAEGDAVADAIVRDAIAYLGAGIASLLAILDPDVLVVGGGVADGLALRWGEVRAATRERALPRYREHLPVERTRLGDDIGLLGAAVHAFNAAGGR